MHADKRWFLQRVWYEAKRPSIQRQVVRSEVNSDYALRSRRTGIMANQAPPEPARRSVALERGQRRQAATGPTLSYGPFGPRPHCVLRATRHRRNLSCGAQRIPRSAAHWKCRLYHVLRLRLWIANLMLAAREAG